MQAREAAKQHSRGGFTLLEMLVTVAVAAVIMVAATQAVLIVTQSRRSNERRLEVAESSATALSLIDWDVSGAGFRFASPLFSVRVLGNVTGAESELGALSPCGPAGWSVAPGSDTLELRYGWDALVPGSNSPMTCNASGQCQVTLGSGGSINPFDGSGVDEVGHLVLMTNAAASCPARITTALSGNLLDVQLVSPSLANANLAMYPDCATGNYTVMRLQRRVRYAVCAPPTTAPDLRPALYRQTEAVGVGDGGWQVPEIVQEGVEDLQVAMIFNNSDNGLTEAGCDAGTPGLCVCGRRNNDCANYNPATTVFDPGGTTTQSMPFRLTGLEVAVVGISNRSLAGRGQNSALEIYGRPAAFDHDAGITLTGDLRKVREASINLVNLSMVNP